MTIVYQRTQNRRTCIWSAMRGGAVPGRTKSAFRAAITYTTPRDAGGTGNADVSAETIVKSVLRVPRLFLLRFCILLTLVEGSLSGRLFLRVNVEGRRFVIHPQAHACRTKFGR